MNWSFEISFLVFLIIVFLSQGIATRLRSLIPMPLILGIFSILGFWTGVLPRDFIEKSNMIVVGTIAYNLLVINGGTMVNIGFIKRYWKNSIICVVSALVIWIVIGLGMQGIIGREIALLSSGTLMGGGATCAIASYMVMGNKPEIAVYPWIIFMFQGLFAIPIINWALKKEAMILLKNFSNDNPSKIVMRDLNFKGEGPNNKTKICDRIPKDYKTTAYYLGLIMLINLANKLVNIKFNLIINQNATALLAGFFVSQIGLIDVGPLYKSDSFGLLLLGLMGLMINTLARNPIGNIIRLLKPMLLVFIVSIIILLILSFIFSRLYRLSIYGVIAMNLNCLVGFPVNRLLVKNAASAVELDEARTYIEDKLLPLLNIGTILIVNTISIIIISVTVNFI